MTQRVDFRKYFTLLQAAAFENNDRRRLKFSPGKADLFIEASEMQVKRRSDS
jgi:hypothetical protein